MAKSLAQIQQQIAKLQKEADALTAKEVSGVVERIKEAISHYGLTVEDLFGATKRGRRASTAAGKTVAQDGTRKKPARKKAVTTKGSRVPVKYRDDAGNTWTGRGNKPRWLVAALAEGRKVEDFLLKS